MADGMSEMSEMETAAAPVAAPVPQAPPETQQQDPSSTSEDAQAESTALPEDLQQKVDGWQPPKLPDSLLEFKRPQDEGISYASYRLREPRQTTDDQGNPAETTQAWINIDKLKSLPPDQLERLGKNPLDLHAEFGGGDLYSNFAWWGASQAEPRCFELTKKGLLPIEDENINSRFTEFLQSNWGKRALALHELQEEEGAPAEGSTANSENPPSELEQDLTRENTAELEQAETVAREEQREQQTISEDEAQQLLGLFEVYAGRIEFLQTSLASEQDEQKKKDIQLELDATQLQKIEVMLTAIGYTATEIQNFMAGKTAKDLLEMSFYLKIAHHTTLSKDNAGPFVTELNARISSEVIGQIVDTLHEGKDETQQRSREDIEQDSAVSVFREAMAARGYPQELQDALIQELFGNDAARALNLTEETTLRDAINALVSGEAIQAMQEETPAGGQTAERQPSTQEQLEQFLQKFRPDVSIAVGNAFAHYFEQYMDIGAFMNMLLVGEGYTAAARDLGYRTKEELEEAKVKPIGVAELEFYFGTSEDRQKRQRDALLAGFEYALNHNESVLTGDQINTLRNMDPSKALVDDLMKKGLDLAFTPKYHRLMSLGMLIRMGEDQQLSETSKIDFTQEAVSWIRLIPQMEEERQKGKSATESVSSPRPIAENPPTPPEQTQPSTSG
ncbi:MAG TPA: hypothetical protein VFG51_03625 [Candidatus Saccharimonadia bacterium]|nr:hypothetical protein [Candidatus Saccharimonadia bacterium]